MLLGTEETMTRRDRILRFFLRPENGQLSPLFGAISLLTSTINLEKRGKTSTGENSEKSSGDSAPKLQISVPCRGRTCPELRRQKLILSEAQLARKYGTEITQIPCKNNGTQK